MNRYRFDPKPYKTEILEILREVSKTQKITHRNLNQILSKYPKDKNGFFSKDNLIAGYKLLVSEGKVDFDQRTLDKIKMKPTRTISGVTPVTVLTKPFPCPGKCIFCPNDVRMPKSYLADEPGAQRAERNSFDPYLQTYNRLQAFHNTGHNTEKIELIILGGTWSFYPKEYQIWFVKRCFDAMNDYGVIDRRDEVKTVNVFEEADKIPVMREDGRRKSYNQIVSAVAQGKSKGFFSKNELATWEELEEQQRINENALSRCVGLVIETRPDSIDEQEVIALRRLGATKIQIGIQSLNNKVHELNKRGHGVAEIISAIKLLREAAFKIHAHWMPNLYGSSVNEDIEDYAKLWEVGVQPDELKIYPTSIIANTELFDIYQKGGFKPYTYEELLKVMTAIIPTTPRYCRLTRIVRDIPSTDIVAGNKLTNFRQIAELELKRAEQKLEDIRSREIKAQKVKFEDLEIEEIEYETSIGKEIFMSYKTKRDDKIVGFLRLSLPKNKDNFIGELKDCSLIREVHVYGQVVGLSKKLAGKSQHLGLGTKLIERAKEISSQNNFKKVAVISAIGTRNYYRKKGFELNDLYMTSSSSL